jgi:hypothetical protein
MVEDRRGYVNYSSKRPFAAGLFFDFGDGRSTTIVFILSLDLARWQRVGGSVGTSDRLKRSYLPRESLPNRVDGSILVKENDTSDI